MVAGERLRMLAEQVGALPLIRELLAHYEAQIRMRCPRCRTQLRRQEMVRHLWEEHRVILDGRRVREGWPYVEDLIARYRTTGDVEWLRRCR